MQKVLEVKNLKISFDMEIGTVEAVKDISFHVDKGELLAIVGESGSGKSVCALSLTGLLKEAGAEKEGGTVLFEGIELDYDDETALHKVRGGGIAYVFQEPLASLNPLHTIEKQMTERLTVVEGVSRSEARRRALEFLKLVGIRDPEARLKDLPHTFSGGERQRIMIAAALTGSPRLLIADEPTTALDVTVQKQILELIAELRQKLDMSIIIISHNLEIVRHYADRVVVIKDGLVEEEGSAEEIFTKPRSDYTKALIAPHPSPLAVPPADGETLLDVRSLSVVYSGRSGRLGKKRDLLAVNKVNFELKQGQSLGIVGESGSGKTSLIMAILRLIAFSGDVYFKGQNISSMNPSKLRKIRRFMQVVFQDPYGSLNPRMTVEMIVAEGLRAYGAKNDATLKKAVAQSLKDVGLSLDIAGRYPHEFSGGQRQRIAIARAIILKPELVIFDEPTSSLDRSVQFQVVELLKSLQQSYDMSYIFVSHDLNLVRSVCHDIIVMKDGAIVEADTAEQIFTSPSHEYTKALISAALFQ